MQSRWAALVLGLICGLTSDLAPAADSPIDKLARTFVDELITVTPGVGKYPVTFEMGDDNGPREERPRHAVKLTAPFAMAKYEVPQNLYQAVMGSNPSRWKGPRNSVEMMSWDDANEFCAKFTVLLRSRKLIGDDEQIRLPTEAEWEYCCRAGTTTRYSFGDEAQSPDDVSPKASILGQYAWHTGNAAGNDPPVGALKPNPWGFYDMHGYLWELTADTWSPNFERATQEDTANAPADNMKDTLIRGGSWKDEYNQLTSSTRRRFSRTAKDDAVGFRCVKSKVVE